MKNTNIIDFRMFSYNKKILQQLRSGDVDEILFQNLYKYRENVDDASFHFLIGLCWLKKGMYHEAYIAFAKAQSILGDTSFKGKLFQAMTLYQAQRDEEAKDMLGDIDLDKLSEYEKIAFMALSNSYGVDCDDLLDQTLKAHFPTETDAIVMKIFAYVYANKQNKANALAVTLKPYMFSNFNTFLFVLGELYKLKLRDFSLKKIIAPVIKKTSLFKLTPEEFMNLLKQLNAFGFRDMAMAPQFEAVIKQNIYRSNKEEKSRWWHVMVQLWAMKLDNATEHGNKELYSKIFSNITKMKYKNEQALLILVTDEMDKMAKNEGNPVRLQKRIEKLISFDQRNVKYRKIYADFAILMGMHAVADDVAKATIAMKKSEEAKSCELLRAFYNFYGNRVCLFQQNENHIKMIHDVEDVFEGEKCPWCFNSGYYPIVRTIGFAHSPASIFVNEKVERKRIEVNEETLQKMVDWMPMNIPSPLVNRYLHKLGAYMSSADYPDVLVAGQTYLFIQLKTETYKRLASEGYSLAQIDPLWVAANITKAERKELQIFSKEDKEIAPDEYPITADDLVIDIIHVCQNDK